MRCNSLEQDECILENCGRRVSWNDTKRADPVRSS